MSKEDAESLSKGSELPYFASAVQAITSLSDGILSVNSEGRVTYLNPSGEVLTGWLLQEAVGKTASEVFRVVNAVTRQVVWQPLRLTMQDNDRYSVLPNSVLIRKDGLEVPIEDSTAPIHDVSGEVIGAVVSFRDTGLSRLMLMKALHRANHDVLTSLPNRAALDTRINQATSMLQDSHVLGLLVIDVDGFKSINDAHGHGSGDLVLQVVAKRIAESLRTSDTVCRAGGDEFIVLLPEVATSDVVARIAEKVLGCSLAPIAIEGNLICITLSIGVSVSERLSANQASVLIKRADEAMYAAKRAGGNCVRWFSPSINPLSPKRGRHEGQLSLALEEQRGVPGLNCANG